METAACVRAVGRSGPTPRDSANEQIEARACPPHRRPAGPAPHTRVAPRCRPAPHLLLPRAVLTSPLPSLRGTGLFIYLPIHLFTPFIYLFIYLCIAPPPPPPVPSAFRSVEAGAAPNPPRCSPIFAASPPGAGASPRGCLYNRPPPPPSRDPAHPAPGGGGMLGGGRGSAQPGPAPRARSGPPRRAEQRPSRRRKWALY